MGIPVRPNKAVGGAGGSSWTAGSDLYANELNEDIDPLYATFSTIDDTNVSSGAAIQGSKLANAPNGIPAGKYNALSVKNADIDDLTIQKGKLSTTATQKITEAQLEILIQEVAFIISVGGIFTPPIVSRKTNAGNYEALVMNVTGGNVTVVPTTAIVVGTKDIIGLYLSDLSYVNPNVSGKVVFISIAKT